MDIGIDLGTTFSVVAVDGKVELKPDYPGGPGVYLDDCDVTVIPTPLGEQTFPSVMIPDPDHPENWLFGAEALQKAEEGFAPVMFSKRKIGTTESISVLNGTVTAKEVAERFLRHMKECAELALGQPVARAVVTHPAYFDRGAVVETRDAAWKAGFDMSLPQQMLMEPTAAALAYTRTDKRDPLRILTYDLGGGTFDVTYMERIDGVIQIRAFDGNHLLGGYNFDKELVRLVRTRLAAKGRNVVLDENNPEDRGRLARLLRIAENVKIELSKTKNDTDEVEFRVRNILVDDKGLPVQVNERITRQQFVAAIQAWLNEIVECCRRALEKGKAKPEDLHQILMVGGSSNGPWVRESLQAAFPHAEIKLFSPDLCVGAGAAIHASMALPITETIGSYRLERETPKVSLLDCVHVSGRFVHAQSGKPVSKPFSVLLKGAAASLPPFVLGDDGHFLFKDVELTEGGNRFLLHLLDEKGELSSEHAVDVQHVVEPQGGMRDPNLAAVTGSPTVTVLPRPLYVKTYRGMVALAKEGVALPAKCVARFERQNERASIELEIYQEQDPAGKVNIEGIPAEAGIGSPIELTLEVTADNQLQGEVVVYRVASGKGQEAAQPVPVLNRRVQIRFDPKRIPEADELRDLFVDLQERVKNLPEDDKYLYRIVGPELDDAIKRIQQGFEHQPFERQEVHVQLSRLNLLLNPPEDDMTPPRREYVTTAEAYRSRLAMLKTRHEEIVAHLKKDGVDEKEIDGQKESLQKSSRFLTAIAEILKKVDDAEKAGLEAYAAKDRQAWPKAYERLMTLEAGIQKMEPKDDWESIRKIIEHMPVPLIKLFFLQTLIPGIAKRFEGKREALAAKGRQAGWAGEADKIKAMINDLIKEVIEIDDDLPGDQVLSKLRGIAQTVLRSIEERVRRFGSDI